MTHHLHFLSIFELGLYNHSLILLFNYHHLSHPNDHCHYVDELIQVLFILLGLALFQPKLSLAFTNYYYSKHFPNIGYQLKKYIMQPFNQMIMPPSNESLTKNRSIILLVFKILYNQEDSLVTLQSSQVKIHKKLKYWLQNN